MFKVYNSLSSNSNGEPRFSEPKYQLNIKVCPNIKGEPDENLEEATKEKTLKIKQFYENFSSHHLGDSGIDLYNFNKTDLINHLGVATIDFEIQCEMIDLTTNEFASYYLVPRSSIANTDFQMANSIGIIDAGYRGNIKAKIRNFNDYVKEFDCGSFFQIIAPDLKPIKVKVVDELSNTTRADGGFGSTNVTAK